MKFGKADATSRRPRKAAKKASTTNSPETDRLEKAERASKDASVKAHDLSELLQKAADMFHSVQSEKKLLFTLGYKKGMWQFEVVNSWQMWFERTLQSEFRASTPEAAVASFLDYVALKNLDPATLATPD